MCDRTFIRPPPLAVAIDGTSYAVRFVDTLTVDGRLRQGWADRERRELVVSTYGDDSLDQIGRVVGYAIAEAIFQLCAEYGVDPATCMRDDADVYIAGPELKAWLDGRLRGSLPDVAAAAWPVVVQRDDGRWPCPFCRQTFAPKPDQHWGWNPAAKRHVQRCHGPGVRFVRFRLYRGLTNTLGGTGGDV